MIGQVLALHELFIVNFTGFKGPPETNSIGVFQAYTDFLHAPLNEQRADHLSIVALAHQISCPLPLVLAAP